MTRGSYKNSRREELLRAGIDELDRYGVTGFSIRRAADACGVSCAAPAKHFGDRNGFLAAVIAFVDSEWSEEQRRILLESGGSLREQIVALGVGYVRFLVAHPQFRSILMLRDEGLDQASGNRRGGLSALAQEKIAEYCAGTGMDEETRTRKQYVIRSLIYGAALMLDNGEMEYGEAALETVRQSIEREFDLP